MAAVLLLARRLILLRRKRSFPRLLLSRGDILLAAPGLRSCVWAASSDVVPKVDDYAKVSEAFQNVLGWVSECFTARDESYSTVNSIE